MPTLIQAIDKMFGSVPPGAGSEELPESALLCGRLTGSPRLLAGVRGDESMRNSFPFPSH